MNRVQLMDLYNILYDMVDQKRITVGDMLTTLEAAGLTQVPKVMDYWIDEEGSTYVFPNKLNN